MAAQWRDQRAFADLVDLLKDRQIKRLCRLGLQEADADEVVFDAFRISWRQMTRLRDPNSYEGWVSVMARRLGVRALAANRRRIGTDADLDGTAIDEAPDRSVLERDELDGLFEGLQKKERALLEDKYLQRLTVEEIARVAGLKGYQIAHQLGKARDKFRRLRGSDHADNGQNE